MIWYDTTPHTTSPPPTPQPPNVFFLGWGWPFELHLYCHCDIKISADSQVWHYRFDWYLEDCKMCDVMWCVMVSYDNVTLWHPLSVWWQQKVRSQLVLQFVSPLHPGVHPLVGLSTFGTPTVQHVARIIYQWAMTPGIIWSPWLSGLLFLAADTLRDMSEISHSTLPTVFKLWTLLTCNSEGICHNLSSNI